MNCYILCIIVHKHKKKFNEHSIVLCPDRENACSDAANDMHAVDMHAGQLLLHVSI